MRKIISLRKYAALLKRFPDCVKTIDVLVTAEFLIKMRLSIFTEVIGAAHGHYKIKMSAIWVPSKRGYDVYWINPVKNNIWHLRCYAKGLSEKGTLSIAGCFYTETKNSRCWDGYLLEQICVSKLTSVYKTFDYRKSNFGRHEWVLQAFLDPSYGLHRDLVNLEAMDSILYAVRNHNITRVFLREKGVLP